MVTIQDAVQYVNGVACTTKKVWCKSTDVKPTEGIGNGSQLREMDTGKDYAFDAESGEWLEQPEEGGGGGGGSSLLVIGGTYDADEDKTTLDKTWNEILTGVTALNIVPQIIISGPVPNGVVVYSIVNIFYNEEERRYQIETTGETFGCLSANDYPVAPPPEAPEPDE